MKIRRYTLAIATVVFAALALPIQLTAQHVRYKLIDLGTFGVPASFIAPTIDGGPQNPGRGLISRGVIVGGAETPIPDPFAPNCSPDCLVSHAFRWQDGVLTDLGTLQGGVDSNLNS